MRKNLGSFPQLGLLAAALFALPAAAQSYDQCIQVLNPSASNAFQASGSVSINAPNCGVLVNSTHNSALRVSGGVSLNAKYIKVRGGVSSSGGSTLTPAPLTGQPAQPDPLTFLIPPAARPCDFTNFRITGTDAVTLNPGTYCNGINMSGSGTVTLNPGMYIMQGGGLNVSGSRVLNGTGVTFFLTKSDTYAYGPLSVSGSAQLNLDAPGSGMYYGILFFQDPAIGTGKPDSAISGGGNSAISGVLYFPTTGLTYSGSASQGNYLIIVADTVRLTGNVSINANFPKPRSPLMPPIEVSVNPISAALRDGQSQQFTATVINYIDPSVTWSVTPAGLGTVTSTGLYTAPPLLTSQLTAIVTATSVEDPTKSASAIVTVTPQVKVDVNPPSAILYQTQSQPFTATVLNTLNTAVNWTIDPPGIGAISATGAYTAPATITSQQVVTVKATSQADTSKFDTATVTLRPPVAVSAAPSAISLIAGQAQQLTATVINTDNTAVTWSKPSGSPGTLTADGLYTAPALVPGQQTVTITATSQFDQTKTDSVVVTLLPVEISVAPPTASLIGGQAQQFTATVTQAPSIDVIWTATPPGIGSLSSTGLYTAPAIVGSAQTVTVTAASVSDPSKTSSATVSLAPVTITVVPTSSTLFVGQTEQFTATVNNASDPSLTWTLDPSSAGTLSAAGLYTAPASIAEEQTVTVTATSVADPAKSASATVTLKPVIVTVTPDATTLSAEQTQQFTATVQNAANTAVTWNASPSNVGTLSATGLFTAPVSILDQQTITITATSQADPSRSDSASLTLLISTITVEPQTVTLLSGQTQQFTSSSQNVTWSISPPGVGTISATGLYTAPASIAAEQSITVTATSTVNPSVSASASVTLHPVTVSVTPTTKSLFAAQTQQFTATVTNTANTAVTWSISPANAGSISAAGLYTAPASIPTQQMVTVTATSVSDPSKSASATVTLQPLTISMSPTAVSLSALQTQQFTATIQGASAAVTWSLSPILGSGTISSTGLYTAPDCIALPRTVTVIATSVSDPSKTSAATVTLLNASGFSYQRGIRINAARVGGATLANFPVVISGTFDYLANVASGGKVQSLNGYDIVFTTDAAGLNRLDHEIESYDPLTGKFVAWVRIPSLSHTKDTLLFMSYGSASINTSQENRAGVWDTNFKGVYHLSNGTSLSPNDSTTNLNHATNTSVAAGAGTLDGAAQFSGSLGYLRLPQATFGTVNSTLTFGVWFKTSATGAILGQTNGAIPPSGPSGWVPALYVDSLGRLRSSLFWHGSTNAQVVSANVYNDNQWHFAVGTFANNVEKLYIDGELAGTRNSSQNSYSSTYAYLLGAAYAQSWPNGANGWLYFNGPLDEVHVSNIERPIEWIRTEYNNQYSPGTFYNILPENLVSLSIQPLSTVLHTGQTQQFESVAVGACASDVTWTISPNLGTISAGGLYTAPTVIVPQEVTVTGSLATNPAINGSSTVMLLPPVEVDVTPPAITMFSGQTRQFNAFVSNEVNTAVTWSMNPQVGTLSSTGFYTAPASITTPLSTVITATSVVDTNKSGTAVVTLSPGTGTQVTQNIFESAFDLTAEALCRRPHVPPVVSAGADQFVNLSTSGNVTVLFEAEVTDFFLNPGAALTYTWSKMSGPGSVTFANPNVLVAQATFTQAGVYTLQLAVNDGVATTTDLVNVTVSPTLVTGLSYSFLITPVASGPNAAGTSVTLQLRLQGFFTNGGPISLTVTGANPRTANLIADGNGLATYTYTGTNPGTDTISGIGSGWCCAPQFPSNVVTVNWVSQAPQLTSSPVTGRFFANDGTGAFNIPGNQQPVFTQSFPNINFNPPSGAGNPTSVNNLTRPFTDIVTDTSGAFKGTIRAEGNDYQAGAGLLYNFSAVFTGSLNVPSAGPVTFTFVSDDGFVFGVGNGATAGGGPTVDTPTATPFQGYPVMGGVNQRHAPASHNITVNFPAAGSYNFEIDYAKGGDNKLTLQMLAGGVPIPAATQLSLTPEQVPPGSGGDIRSFTLTVINASGVVVPNAAATVTITGPNEQSRTVVTDAQGQVGFAYAGSALRIGTDRIQASMLVNGATPVSNLVEAKWNTGINEAPLVSAGPSQSVTLPAKAVLYGSASDDGLPNDTLTITWSKISGPGNVTFDDPNQAPTAAEFSLAGTYVLELRATDGALTTASTVTIAVNANGSWSSGWIGAPANGATITEPTPITVASGVTLTDGDLVIYPVDDFAAITVLNANTTGTGQIGVLDPTTLENGKYFIDLRATNSNGETQLNLALITVAGDYKPGRVTATVTDLTVPSPGLPIQIQRTYDSLVRGQVGDFGYGWTLGVSLQMQVSPNGDVTMTIGGRRRTFYFTPPPNPLFSYWYTPQYTAEPGLYGSLVNTGDNCTGVLQKSGNIWQCAIANAGSLYQPTGYRYTDPQGRIYLTGPSGEIQSIQDLNGNTLTIGPGGISSTSGLSVPFVRDTQGRITRITDTRGENYDYAYDPVTGDLVSVAYPGIATAAQFTYDPGHLLKQERDNRGNVAGTTVYYPDGKLQSVTDAVGNTTSYVYNTATRTTAVTNPDLGTTVTVADAYGMPLTVTDPLGRVTTYTYDSKHNVLTETNDLGETTTYTYDANGFRTSLKDPLNNVYSAAYNAVGGPTAVTNPLNQTQSVAYDTNFRISGITDSLGQVAQFTYSATGLPLTLKDARQNTSVYTYDAGGNKTSYKDPLNRTTNYVYDTLGNLTSQTDARGKTTTYVYDAFNRRTSMTDADNKTTVYVYDGNGNKISETDALNRTTQYVYDSENRITQVRYPADPAPPFQDALPGGRKRNAGETTRSYTYDWRGSVLTETDELGRVEKYVYDLAGQLTSVTMAFGTPDEATTSYTYDDAGRRSTETDPRGNTTTYTYDAAGRLIKTRDPIGNETLYGYDSKSQRTSLTDAKNRVTTYTYDSRGRQLTTTAPDNKSVTQTFDGLGLLLTTTDEENRTTTFEYDAASQLTAVIDALNQRTEYTYDPAGNKLTEKDARSNVTSYSYDDLNRRTSRVLPLLQTELFTYDAVGNMVAHRDFNAKTTTYAYDSLNRLLSRTPDASFSAPAVTFTYTLTGKRATMTDASGETTYTYNDRDQVLTKATPQGTLTYTFDLAGNVTSVTSSNTGGTEVDYTWDQNNRLATVVDARTGTTAYTYDPTNQLASFTYPNAIVHSYTYDDRDRLTVLNAGPVVYTQTYSFSGRKLTSSESTGRNVGYSYDAIYRLLNENTPDGSLHYTLDQVGNRLALTSTLAALQSQAANYDSNDRISGDAFDDNGNTTSSSGLSYTYDFEDRLLATSSGVLMTYDGDGNRVSKTESGVTTKYLVDEITPTGWPQVAEEIVNGSVVAQYTHGLMRISQNRGGSVSYYGYDDGGSVRRLFDSAAAVTDTYTYDAFGETIIRTGSTANSYQYRGEQFDTSLQMYYLRARWYWPRTGRFLTEDRYEGNDRNPLSLNAYLFVESDPANGVDPSGFARNTVGIGNITRQVFSIFNTNMRGVTLGQVRAGAKLAYDTICCLDKTWSVLDIAAGGPTAAALAAIEAACKLDCRSSRDKGKTFIVYRKRGPSGGTYMGRAGGHGTPEQVRRQRDARHHRADHGSSEILFVTDNYNAARGLEQLAMGLVGEIGDAALTNAIRGISMTNPKAALFLKCALEAAKGGAGALLP